jgi:hypothetical protein
MFKTVFVMATITIIACAAVVGIYELLTRVRHPQAGPPPRRRAFSETNGCSQRQYRSNARQDRRLWRGQDKPAA